METGQEKLIRKRRSTFIAVPPKIVVRSYHHQLVSFAGQGANHNILYVVFAIISQSEKIDRKGIILILARSVYIRPTIAIQEKLNRFCTSASNGQIDRKAQFRVLSILVCPA